MTRRIDPNVLFSVLLEVGSIEAAAKHLGVSSRTITRRRKSSVVFRLAIDSAQKLHRARTFPHGTDSGYSQNCRCEPCTVAHRIVHRRLKEERSKRLHEATHGLESTYTNWLCRCAPCVKAHSDALKDRYWKGKR